MFASNVGVAWSNPQILSAYPIINKKDVPLEGFHLRETQKLLKLLKGKKSLGINWLCHHFCPTSARNRQLRGPPGMVKPFGTLYFYWKHLISFSEKG